MPAVRLPSVLILGPTGAGKTPLGDFWQTWGLAGRRCFHFDFGAELRAAAASESRLEPADLEIVRRALRTGALLEDGQFPIALKILASFIRERGVGSNDILILNGLPRHAGQARDMEAYVEIKAVVRLRAARPVILARIRSNAAGDRAGRTDDDHEAVAVRWRLFEARTAPLEAFYGQQGVPLLIIEVAADTSPAAMAEGVRDGLEVVFSDRLR
ncbi:MAG: nucleoside monophosphate kinase [Acidobacteriota bacterium]|nr:nucleoside monophosphate kinase [Acidobacteriota bacterium]